MTDPRQHAPATTRNRDAILTVLRSLAPPAGLVLEIASGTGEHTACFAAALPHLDFQPTEPDAARRASIDAWCELLTNVRPALALDAAAPAWPVARAALVLCCNLIHIAAWPVTEGLIAGAARVLGQGGSLLLYGPFRREGRHTAPSNTAFDAGLRAQNPDWGVRDLEAVAHQAAAAGFAAPAVIAMPANNLCVSFRRHSC